MEESIFFNRGNAIASNIDLKALYEEVQKAKKKTDKKKKYVIVKKSFEYFLFEEAYFNTLDNKSDYEVIEYV